MKDFGLHGKKAIITGGATGIGRAIAIDLAKQGVAVAFTTRSEQSKKETLELLQKYENNHYGIVIDISKETGPQEVYTKLQENFGNIDIIVNNVGDTLGIVDPLCPVSDWKKVYRLNLEVHVEINNLFIPHMKTQKWGRIVNITAGASMENSGPVPYCSIKAAYTAYSRSMGRVLAPDNIVMSAVLPGVVLTERGHWSQVLKERPEHADKYLQERTSLKRFGKPEEISPFVVMLCSEYASFCQGSIFPVDGGQARHYFQTYEIGT